jgi:hypothetical protein
VQTVVTESNFGDGMFNTLFGQYLRSIYPKCGLDEVTQHGVKDLRILDILEPVISSHRLIVSRAVIRQDHATAMSRVGESAPGFQLFYQMSRIQREPKSLAHYDRLEALSMALNYFDGLMGRNPEQEIDRRKKKDLKDELKSFTRNIRGKSYTLSGGARRRRRDPNWFS